MEPRLLLGIVLGAFVAMRLTEGVVNRIHTKRLVGRGAVSVRPDGFYGIAATQLLGFAGLIVEGILLPQRGAILWTGTYALLGVAALAMALRIWCMATLGERWTYRVWILPTAPLVVGGPYRFLRHPNYVAVFLEYVTVPLAFGLWWTAAIVVPLGAATLLNRRRIEERALSPLRTPAS